MSPLRNRLMVTICLSPVAYRAAQPPEPRSIGDMVGEVFALARNQSMTPELARAIYAAGHAAQ